MKLKRILIGLFLAMLMAAVFVGGTGLKSYAADLAGLEIVGIKGMAAGIVQVHPGKVCQAHYVLICFRTPQDNGLKILCRRDLNPPGATRAPRKLISQKLCKPDPTYKHHMACRNKHWLKPFARSAPRQA